MNVSRSDDPSRSDPSENDQHGDTAGFLLTAAPHVVLPESTPKIMWSVVGSLVPIVVAAAYYFGISALLVIAASCAGGLLVEALCTPREQVRRAIGDGSVVITGLLLGLTLPPGLPLWMAFVGGAFGVAFGKTVFGGLGQNVFNPALLGRAFLQAAFPVAITTYPTMGGGFFTLRGDNFAWPLMSPKVVDGMTGATPLGLAKFEKTGSDFSNLFLGSTPGSVGETCGVLILICGGYLAWKKYLEWRIPVSIFIATALFSGLLWLIDGDRFPSPPFMLFAGGLMLGAVYMATDMVTSPVTHRGCWIFGAGIGLLVVVIRVWGGLNEGVMYAILLMNAMVPFINRATQPRVFGTGRARIVS